jgi:hypothetical protein
VFCSLKDERHIATRYDKLATNFIGAVYLVAAITWWLLSPGPSRGACRLIWHCSELNLVMRPVAQRRGLRLLASAKISRAGLLRRVELRPEIRARVAAVAIRLIGAQSAGAPIHLLASLKLDRDRLRPSHLRLHYF